MRSSAHRPRLLADVHDGPAWRAADLRAAAPGNILESRRRIRDGVERTHGLLSEWWSAHATGLMSVCLQSCPTGPKR